MEYRFYGNTSKTGDFKSMGVKLIKLEQKITYGAFNSLDPNIPLIIYTFHFKRTTASSVTGLIYPKMGQFFLL